MVRILLHGCGGSMGRVVADTVAADSHFEITAGVDPVATDTDFPFPLFKTLAQCDLPADVIIDFSVPATIKDLLKGAREKNIPLIIATTGHTDDDKVLIKKQSKYLPIFQAANMSLGINLMSELIQKAAAVLGDGFDIEIVEKHHNRKKDAPSGTAFTLAEAINQVFTDKKQFVYGRHTRDEPRQSKDIGIHAVRGGTIVGEHTVLFAGKDEVFDITHAAHSRQVFAVGALQAARFIQGKAPGYYSMQEMLTEQSAITHMYLSEEDALVSIHDFPHGPRQIADLFKRIGQQNIIVDMISQTAPTDAKISLSFTMPRKSVEIATALLEAFQGEVADFEYDVLTEITKITVEGPGMEVQSGVAAQLFDLMAAQGIAVHTVTTSETKIAYIVPQADSGRAIQAVKKAFEV